MRLFSLLLTVLLLSTPALAEDRYVFDKSHTRILFFVNHLGYSDTVGEFTDYDGGFVFNEKEPEKSSIDVTLKPVGIRTPSKELDEHLQNKDFFHTAKYPTIHFVSKEVKVTGKNTADVIGDLTLLGTTKPITLAVTFNKAAFHPMNGKYVAGFSARATVKRSDFAMNYLVPMVGDDVRVEIHTEGFHVTKTAPKANN